MTTARLGVLVWLIASLAGCIAVKPTQPAEFSLDGVELRLVRHNGQINRVEQLLTLVRDGDGVQVTGFAGCNRFSGRAEFDSAGRLSVGPLAATRRGCTDAAVAERENAYLAALSGQVFEVAAEGPNLQLRGERDTLAFAALQ
ncbi:MAG: META domain-containing protein [Pseudomonadota bacterium]